MPLHPVHVAPAKPTLVAPNARASPVSSIRRERRRLGRAELARFCMSRALTASAAKASLFASRRKRPGACLGAPAPSDNEMRLATQQEPEKSKVMARRSSDRSGLFPAEVPNGPIRTCPVTRDAVAVPLHPVHVAPAKPTLVAPNAREQASRIGKWQTDSQWEFSQASRSIYSSHASVPIAPNRTGSDALATKVLEELGCGPHT